MLEKFFIVAILFVTGCSYTQPYVTNISPAGKNRILVEKCKMQRNQLFFKNNSICSNSYVFLGSDRRNGRDKQLFY